MTDRFEWNFAGLAEMCNDVCDVDCVPVAERAADFARATAPVDTGAYRDSIHVEVDRRTGEEDWARARVVASDRKAPLIESRHGTLARALNSVAG